MKPQVSEQGFTLIEVLAAMLLLSLAYVAVMESFSSSLARVSRLDRHYRRLLEAEETILATPLFFAGMEGDDTTGELYLEGQQYKLLRVKQESGAVETLVLVKN